MRDQASGSGVRGLGFRGLGFSDEFKSRAFATDFEARLSMSTSGSKSKVWDVGLRVSLSGFTAIGLRAFGFRASGF